MQIVIDIPEEVYSFITTECSDVTISENKAPFEYIIRGIIDGTVLPKGHGDLIDRDTITVEEDVYFQNYIIHAPTIIKADEGDGE